MTQKIKTVSILIMVLAGIGAHAYGAKGDLGSAALATLYFKIDSADIKSEFENDLKKIQAMLESDPDIGLHINAYGLHAGASQKDRQISQKRIQAIQQWFVKHGVAKSRLITQSVDAPKSATRKSGTEKPALSERVDILRISLKQPLAFLPIDRYQFDPVVEGQEVTHAFVVQNKGTASLEIQKVKTD